ncbi:unnamed protein product [Symbiodinium sp. CCMP2592]|nr:unnamed protein product [Symbiodinium sp. CCMP2592]
MLHSEKSWAVSLLVDGWSCGQAAKTLTVLSSVQISWAECESFSLFCECENRTPNLETPHNESVDGPALHRKVLLLIFDTCFLPRSDTAAQHLLQFWYFAFLLFFVLFLPIIGTNFRDFAHQVYKSPAQVLGLVAARVPKAAEFFFDYVVLMWSVACAGPSNSVGKRARGVFPLVSLAVLVKFLLQQVAYGYLLVDVPGFALGSPDYNLRIQIHIVGARMVVMMTVAVMLEMVFAETRKPDLGGVFWVQALTQLLRLGTAWVGRGPGFKGLPHYTDRLVQVEGNMTIVVMTGVLLQRSDGYIPAALALLSGFVAVASVVQFKMRFRWQSLPYPEAAPVCGSGVQGVGHPHETVKQETLNPQALNCNPAPQTLP